MICNDAISNEHCRASKPCCCHVETEVRGLCLRSVDMDSWSKDQLKVCLACVWSTVNSMKNVMMLSMPWQILSLRSIQQSKYHDLNLKIFLTPLQIFTRIFMLQGQDFQTRLSCVESANHEHFCSLTMQIMQLGGNQRARKYFKQHGWDGLGADKIEQKVKIANMQLVPLALPCWFPCGYNLLACLLLQGLSIHGKICCEFPSWKEIQSAFLYWQI